MKHNHNKYGFEIGDIVVLDEDHPNSSLVKILNFTPNQMFVTVQSLDSTESNFWETMTNRLSPVIE